MKMETRKNYIIDLETNDFVFTPSTQNTSCTGGTITNISLNIDEDDAQTTAYVLTLKELRSCNGFEDISSDQAEIVIQTLSQLSALSYQVLIDE